MEPRWTTILTPTFPPSDLSRQPPRCQWLSVSRSAVGEQVKIQAETQTWFNQLQSTKTVELQSTTERDNTYRTVSRQGDSWIEEVIRRIGRRPGRVNSWLLYRHIRNQPISRNRRNTPLMQTLMQKAISNKGVGKTSQQEARLSCAVPRRVYELCVFNIRRKYLVLNLFLCKMGRRHRSNAWARPPSWPLRQQGPWPSCQA